MRFRLPPVPQEEIRLAQDAFMSGEEARISAYRTHYAALDWQTKAYVGYALAAMFHMTETFGLPAYIFFFRKDTPKLRAPLSFIGWAGKNSEVGPSYRIEPDCFIGSPITLYYSDDDLIVYDESVCESRKAYAHDLAKDIARLSSGITDVHAVLLPGKHDAIITDMQDMNKETCETWGVVFTLDPAAVNPNVVIQGKTYDTSGENAHVFILPHTGEFDCTIGEFFDNGLRLPLRTDSYCMK